jgi:hypothetical protein
MSIHHCRRDILVSQQFLNSTNIMAAFQQMGGKRMVEGMATRGFGNPGTSNREFNVVLQVLFTRCRILQFESNNAWRAIASAREHADEKTKKKTR